jgi:guanylate kinase
LELGKLIIFSAPSGSGKTTLVHYLMKQVPGLAFSVSACTRPKRPNELDGVDYHFLTPEAFQLLIEKDAFVEYEEVYPGNFYGTLKESVDKIRKEGKHVLFDIDVEGGLNIKNAFGDDALGVFVRPPSVDVLIDRLTRRSTESDEKIKQRVGKAVFELQYEPRFDVTIVNDNLDIACQEAEHLVRTFIARP